MSVNSLRRWMNQADIADGLAAGPSDGRPDAVVALRRRLRLLEQENEVLRRAAAFLSRDVSQNEVSAGQRVCSRPGRSHGVVPGAGVLPLALLPVAC